MTKHTKGPWVIGDFGRVSTLNKDKSGEWYEPIDLDNEANANLIAAAPELLDLCKHVLANIRSGHGNDTDTSLQRLLEQTVAKAEGK